MQKYGEDFKGATLEQKIFLNLLKFLRISQQV
ncbi:MAG: hypothetical protein ACI9V1_002285 [Spirosomataceae bacterium]|jgi:hypothetical protein